MPSGVVFVAILVIWAVILAPRAVKLYERTATVRTTSRFSSAMSVLGSGKAAARVAVDTARRGSRVVIDAPTSVVGPSQGFVVPPSARVAAGAGKRAAGRAVQRRRQVASICAAVFALAVVAVVLGALPLLALPVAAVPLVVYLTACAAAAGTRRKREATRVSPAVAAVEQPVSKAGGRTDPMALPSRRVHRVGLRAGSWTQARILEADLAIAATYASTEERLGLDRYVASPSDVDGEPYLRAANE